MGSTKDTACILTLGNGTEFHSYKQLEAVVATRCYFATPHHSWERGGNENAKGLVRQYRKKRVLMAHVTRCGGLHPIKESRAEFSKTVEQHLDSARAVSGRQGQELGFERVSRAHHGSRPVSRR